MNYLTASKHSYVPSVAKRNYTHVTSTRPYQVSVSRQIKYSQKINYPKLQNSSTINPINHTQNKNMISSVKDNKNNQYYNYNERIQREILEKQKDRQKYQKQKQRQFQFRISDPKKSQSSLRTLHKQEQDRKTPDYPKVYRAHQQSIKIQKPLGLVGLNNIGNTCFMNSTLQCLFNLPEFNEYFLEEKHLKQVNSSSCKVAMSYGRLIKAIRGSSYRAETPSELKNAVASKKTRFQGYSQQDAQQFLTGILQLLSQQLNRSSKPRYKQLKAETQKYSLSQISKQWWDYNKQREDSIVTNYFTGQLLSRVVCCKCSNQSVAFDNTWDFALNFNRHDDVEVLKMVQNFLSKQRISSDYYCAKCKTFRECQRKLDFFRLPKILVLQLKRFSYGKLKKNKLNNRIKIRQTLDLSSLISESNHESVKNPIYELVGIVNHSGDIDYGHYTADCRNPGNKKWYTFNDSSVYENTGKQNYDSPNPYLLFYTKRDIL